MSLKNSLKKIKNLLVKKYNNNLAAVLLFGSANTGHYRKGKSDIDLIILFKDKNKLNLEKEKKSLFKELNKENAKILHFKTIKNYEAHIYRKGSFSSWITVINGSKKLYSTKEFQKFRKRLISKPIPRKKLINYLKKKDKFDFGGYLKGDRSFGTTKSFFSHIKRKLQILNYIENKKTVFDYKKCLGNLNLKDKTKLKRLYESYTKRKGLSKKELKNYYQIALNLTKKI